MEDGTLYSSDKALFEAMVEHFGLKPTDHGEVVKARGEIYRVLAINPNRPKYPITSSVSPMGVDLNFRSKMW